jgi:hypothetical protein
MLKYGKPSALPARVSHIPTSATVIADKVYVTDPLEFLVNKKYLQANPIRAEGEIQLTSEILRIE